MNTNVKAKDIELTPEIYDYLNKKMAALEKFVTEDDTGAKADIELGKTTNKHKTGDIYFTEINFTISDINYRVSANGDSLMAAMDKAKDIALERIRTEKGKTADHQL